MSIANNIEIYVNPPREMGFGWTVDCSDCDLNEKMLSETGAKSIAKQHAADHKPTIITGGSK